MNGSNIDSELQCEWAKTLASSSSVNLKEVEALVNVALSSRSSGLKPTRSRTHPGKNVDGYLLKIDSF